jgi:hypothetical protein
MGTTRVEWDDEEMLRVLVFYASLDGNQPSREDLLALQARMPGRSLSTIKLRIANYVARDPRKKALGLKGMSGSGNKATAQVSKYLNEDGSFNLHKLLLDSSTKL